jgi:hypothetical protein
MTAAVEQSFGRDVSALGPHDAEGTASGAPASAG